MREQWAAASARTRALTLAGLVWALLLVPLGALMLVLPGPGLPVLAVGLAGLVPGGLLLGGQL